MKKAGVYIHWSVTGAPLYVGQTSDLSTRTTSHKTASFWSKEIHHVDFLECEDPIARGILERETIRSLKPKNNVRHIDLPRDEDIFAIHHAHTECRFYECVKRKFSISSDLDLAQFLGVSISHILMVRLRICPVSSLERAKIALILGCSPVDVAGAIGEKKRKQRLRSSQVVRRIKK